MLSITYATQILHNALNKPEQPFRTYVCIYTFIMQCTWNIITHPLHISFTFAFCVHTAAAAAATPQVLYLQEAIRTNMYERNNNVLSVSQEHYWMLVVMCCFVTRLHHKSRHHANIWYRHLHFNTSTVRKKDPCFEMVHQRTRIRAFV